MNIDNNYNINNNNNINNNINNNNNNVNINKKNKFKNLILRGKTFDSMVFENKKYEFPRSYEEYKKQRADGIIDEDGVPLKPPTVESSSSIDMQQCAINNEEPIQHWVDPQVKQDIADRVTSLPNEHLEKVSEVITLALNTAMGFSGSTNHLNSVLVSSLTSALSSMVSHTFTLSRNTLDKTTKTTIGISIVTNLTNLANTIWFCSYHWGGSKELAKVGKNFSSMIPEVAQTFIEESQQQSIYKPTEIQANNTNWLDFITPAFKCIMTVGLLVGTGLDKSKIDYAIKLGALTDLVNKTSKTSEEIMDTVLTKICGVDITGDIGRFEKIRQLSQRTEELAILPPYKFLQNPKLCSELQGIYKQSLELKTPDNAKMTQSLRIAISGLTSNLNSIRDKVSTIQEILDVKRRQECLGVLLAGEHNVGKSAFAMYMMERVADILGYPKDVYNVDREGGFYTPYNGAVFGILNEFCAQRSEDPTLKSFNKIVSADPYNMEAASLPSKTQPCWIKLLVATSNTIAPNLHPTLIQSAISALWSRTIRVMVEDKEQAKLIADGKVHGRHTKLPHRKPDFSHLTFSYTMDTDPQGVNINYTSISTNSLINMVAAGVAKREYDFLTENISKIPSLASDSQPRLDFLKQIIDKRVIANEEGNFFVTRIQGPLGGGKTTLAHSIANNISHVLRRMKIVKLQNFNINSEIEPKIFIVDDLISGSPGFTYDDYVRWINSIPKSSIVLLIQNKTFKKGKHMNDFALSSILTPMVEAYDVRGISNISGVGRRLGLNGRVLTDDSYYINSDSQITIDAVKNYKFLMNSSSISYTDIPDMVFRYYLKYRETCSDISIMYEEPPFINKFDIDIKAKTVPELMYTLSSVRNVMKGFRGVSGYSTIDIDLKLLKNLQGKTIEKDWVVAEQVRNVDQLVNLGQRVYSSVARLQPSVTVRLLIEEEEIQIVAKDRSLYVSADLGTQMEDTIIWSTNLIIYTTGDKQVYIEPSVFSEYYVNENITGSLVDLQLHQIKALTAFYERNNSPYKVSFTNMITEKKNHLNILRSNKFKHWLDFKKHPVLIILGSVLGATTVITSLTYLLKWFFSKEKCEVFGNSFDDENDLMQMKRKYFQNRTNPKFESRQFFREINQKGYGPRFDEWLDSLQSNSLIINPKFEDIKLRNNWTDQELIAETLKHNSRKDIKSLMLSKPDQFLEVLLNTSNMLSAKEIKWQPSSTLELFRDSLAKSYVLVNSKGGCNYGLGLKDNYILTVSHPFDKVGEDLEISSNGIVFKAQCIKIMRSRDLAIIKVLDKRFPSLPNITKKIITNEQIGTQLSSFFLRPIQGGTIYQLPVRFKNKVVDPYTDPRNSNYQLSEKIWATRFICGSDLNSIVKKGDCGFPLVGLVNNEYKILGIHNAFNAIGEAFFSCITVGDLERADLQSNMSQTMMLSEILPGIRHRTPAFYLKAFENFQSSCYTGISPLKVLCFCPTLNIISFPKNTKKKIKIPDAKTQCLTEPSALKFEPYMDPTGHYKNAFGKIVPVFTQAVKFSQRTKTYGDYNLATSEHVFSLLKMRIKRDYGSFHMINTKKILNGEPGSPLNPFDLKTSGGLYLKAQYSLNDKSQIIKNAGTIDKPYFEFNDTLIAKEVRDLYLESVKSILEGVPPIMFARDCPKVELLPVDKVKKGKVRLFNELDFHYNMMLKAYFGKALESIIKHHVFTPYKIGMNPYIEATIYMMDFNALEGELLCTDVSALDKSYPKELISYFVKTFCDYLQDYQQDALILSLTNTVHVLDGSVYTLTTGNESGSFITTMLNCYAMEFLLCYYYSEIYMNRYSQYPTLQQFEQDVVYIILGDDLAAKFSNDWQVSVPDYAEKAALFNINITEAKNNTKSGFVSFCSREYIPDKTGLWYYPALKQSSVVSSLWWYEQINPIMIAQNINVVLFEAALHDRDFYDKVLHDVLLVINMYQIDPKIIDLCTYELYREYYRSYVSGEVNSPTFLAVGSYARYNKIDKLQTLNQANSKLNKMSISQLNEYMMKMKIVEPLDWHDSSSGPEHIKTWNSVLKFQNFKTEGTGVNKKFSREDAALKMLNKLEVECNTLSGDSDIDSFVRYTISKQIQIAKKALSQFERIYIYLNEPYYSFKTDYKIVETIRVEKRLCKNGDPIYSILSIGAQEAFDISKYQSILKKIGLEFTEDKYGLVIQREIIRSNMMNYDFDKYILFRSEQDIIAYNVFNNEYYKGVSKVIPDKNYIDLLEKEVKQLPATRAKTLYYSRSLDKPKIEFGKEVIANMDKVNNVATEPAIMNQASSAQQASTLPSNTNPQPTSVAPSMTTTGEDIMGAVQPLPTDILQPVGAPPMLGVGAISFDLKSLVYEQFIDSDIEFTIADDQPSGTIVMQIPYDPLGTYVNKYIKAWAQLHERYTGALQFRFTLIGNPMFSGAVGICWRPRKVAGTTIDISETMKYAYHAEGVTLPWNRVHLLHDARRQFFYRTTTDTDIDDRPHLVVYLLMSIQNPLKPDAITRIRVSSKLANASEPNSFMFANPELPVVPSIATLSPYLGNFFSVFKQCFYDKMFMYTDGPIAGTQYSNLDYYYYPFNLNYPNQVGTPVDFFPTEYGLARMVVQTASDTTPWPSFNNVGNVSVRLTTFGATEYFTEYAAQWDQLFGYITNGHDSVLPGEAAFKYYFETAIPTGLAIYLHPQNKLQAVWFYSAPMGDVGSDFANYGCYKMIFDQGVVLVDAFKLDANSSLSSGNAKNPTLNYKYVDSARTYLSPSVIPIPSNCSVLRLTTQQPSSVPTGITGPTARDDEAMLRYFGNIASKLASDQVIQMKLVDVSTQRNIATIRYDSTYNYFYIFGSNGSYLANIRDFKNINVDIEIVPLSNPMNFTDVSSWVSRTSSTIVRKPIYTSEFSPWLKTNQVTSNASFIPFLAQAFSGQKSTQSSIFDFAQQIYGTERGISSNKEMQGNYQDWRGKQNQLERDFLSKMQGSNFEQQSKMQQNEIRANQQNIINRAYLSGTTTGLRNLPGAYNS